LPFWLDDFKSEDLNKEFCSSAAGSGTFSGKTKENLTFSFAHCRSKVLAKIKRIEDQSFLV